MILILTDDDESSTNDVIDWLFYYNIPFRRINENSVVFIEQLVLEDKTNFILNVINPVDMGTVECINLCDLTGFWYRRGEIKPSWEEVNHGDFSKKELKNLNYYLKREYFSIVKALYMLLGEKKNIGSIFENETNKTYNLHLAKMVGLDIPETLITGKKEALQQFSKKHKELITKAARHGGFFLNRASKIKVFGFTSEIKKDEIDELDAEFYPSLFQKKLEKAFELRIFYFDGAFFSTAIFSQQDEQTKIDFRQYNYENPNRVVPFSLPILIEQRLDKLMNMLKMKSGSIDMVVTVDNEFIFLEVNPIGQFRQVSLPGNYYLEKRIAHYFT